MNDEVYKKHRARRSYRHKHDEVNELAKFLYGERFSRNPKICFDDMEETSKDSWYREARFLLDEVATYEKFKKRSE